MILALLAHHHDHHVDINLETDKHGVIPALNWQNIVYA